MKEREREREREKGKGRGWKGFTCKPFFLLFVIEIIILLGCNRDI